MMGRIRDVDVEKGVTFQVVIFLRPIDFDEYCSSVCSIGKSVKMFFFFLLLA